MKIKRNINWITQYYVGQSKYQTENIAEHLKIEFDLHITLKCSPKSVEHLRHFHLLLIKTEIIWLWQMHKQFYFIHQLHRKLIVFTK